jgi:hypothetical protein
MTACPLFLVFFSKIHVIYGTGTGHRLRKHISFICTVTGIVTKQCCSTHNFHVVERVPVPVLTRADQRVGCFFSKNKTAADDVTVIERKMFFF